MSGRGDPHTVVQPVPTFVLSHHHQPAECRIAFAAWKGFDSPLRHSPAVASCASGGHRIYWTVEAESAEAALAQLPEYLALRTEVSEVTEVPIP
jgi:hypothetical protein